MVAKQPSVPQETPEAARDRRLEAMHLQAIEHSPLDAEQTAMFEMFEREGWSHERRLQHIRERVAAATHVTAAE